MRKISLLCLLCLLASLSVSVLAQEGQGETLNPFVKVEVKPQIAIHEFPLSTANEYMTVTGVVFSRSPIDRVLVAGRDAMIRPAEPEDLIRFERVPKGASEAPFRTYFELPDALLEAHGANSLNVRALTTDGRQSDIHRLTVIRTLEEPRR